MSRLVIVESPTKAKTIGKFLGKNYRVESSFGHVRDLPKSKLGVDVDAGFIPSYVVPLAKRKQVTELKKIAARADEILFATDEDREGEAISWHLAEVLGENPDKIKRITFHEITKKAIEQALAHPRQLDKKLVDAQQARRILDRLVGYELSPFLWKKVQRGLSAGRVQSVAVRLVVEREREIEKFKPEEYWSIDAIFTTDNVDFAAKLAQRDTEKLEKFAITSADEAINIVTTLSGAQFKIVDVDKKTATRQPPPPFTTSTLQQEANRRLGASAKMTMVLAQRLYEGVEMTGEGSVGLITYMRTDSVNLSSDFQQEAINFITDKYGREYTTGPRSYTTKSKLAQEAHEAIHPTDIRRTPEMLAAAGIDNKLIKLYDLIWRRAMASQMSGAEFDQTGIDVAAVGSDQKKYIFRANGQTIKFAGFLAVYPDQQKETVLPVVKTNETVTAKKIAPNQHFTEPPARYSDATLVKILEEYGIGRPSTYAPTIATVIDRGYVERDEKRRLKPTTIALTVTDLLLEHFPNIADYEFTAQMEDALDAIADGQKEMVPILREFYNPFKKNLTEKLTTVKNTRPPDEPTNEVCPNCGKPLVIKTGRFGKFFACTGYPECKTTKPIINPIGIKCSTCHTGDIVEKRSRRGKIFYSCSRYPECKTAFWDKPIDEQCATCQATLTITARGIKKCSNPDCATRAKKIRKQTTAPEEKEAAV